MGLISDSISLYLNPGQMCCKHLTNLGSDFGSMSYYLCEFEQVTYFSVPQYPHRKMR